MCNQNGDCCHSKSEAMCRCNSHLSRFVEPRLFLLLKEKESYGYELIQKIDSFSFSDTSLDPGAVYRELRSLEREDLIRSRWDTKGSGPARRLYQITNEGEEVLDAWAVSLKKRKEAIEKFLAAYENKESGK